MGLATVRLGWIWWQRSETRPPLARAVPTLPYEEFDAGLRITHFYARAGEITDGEPNLICYGVRNARSVRIEPAVENLSPSLNRCFFTEPRQDTEYRLVAEGSDGAEASAAFQVRVKPAPPEIRLFAVSEKRIVRNDAVTLCYGVAHAMSVRLDPDGWNLAPVALNCARIYPKASGTFTLVATGAGGRTERRKFAVEVK